MPINFPMFQGGQVPLPRPIQPFQQPQHYDPAQIIMQAAQLRQQQDLHQQDLQQRSLQGFLEAAQGAASLREKAREADMQNAISEGTLQMHQQTLDPQIQLMRAQAAHALSQAAPGMNFYSPEQAAYVSHPEGQQSDLKSSQDQWLHLYPNGMIPKDAVHNAAMMGRTTLQLGTKQEQFDTKRWTDMLKDADPYNASSRTAFGQAGVNNKKADRAMQFLNDPNATDQQIKSASIDLASILKGGSADELEIKTQMYDTLYSRWNGLLTYLQSNPQSAKQPQVQEQLKRSVMDIKNVDNQAIKDQLDLVEARYPDMVSARPEAWQKYRTRLIQTLAVPGEEVLNPGLINAAKVEWLRRKAGSK